MGWPRNLASPTAEGSTGGFLSIKAKRSRKSGAIRSDGTRAPSDGCNILNRTRSGSYVEAVRLAEQTGTTPVVQAIRRPGTLKYGTGISFDQELSHDVGVFTRLGWNDGKTEDFAFTAIDRLAEGGVSVKGTRWKRKDDVVATAFAAAGISGVHAVYLAEGGLDFLIGDGKLNYAPEYLWESYYSARVVRGFYCDLRRAALQQSGLQSRSRTGLGGVRPAAHRVRDQAAQRQVTVVEMSQSDSARHFLRHTVATLAYRAAKPLHGAPDSFCKFKASADARTPVEILAHMGDLFDWALSTARGEQRWHVSTPLPWPDEVHRFFAALEAFDDLSGVGQPAPSARRKAVSSADCRCAHAHRTDRDAAATGWRAGDARKTTTSRRSRSEPLAPISPRRCRNFS